MIEEDKYCADILTQIAAVRAAINKVGNIILEKHSKFVLKTLFLRKTGKKQSATLLKICKTY